MLVAGALVLASCASASPAAAPPSSTSGTPVLPSVARTPVPATVAPSTTTTLPPPPAAPVAAPYDNTLAAQACTLLAPDEIKAQFAAPVAAGVPVFPYCWWQVGTNGFVSLTIFDKKPLSTYRAYAGLAVGDVPDLGEGAFFASNKTLFVGVRGSTYVVQFERGAEWVDTNRPKLVALAQLVLDRLGFVPAPKPPPTTAAPRPDDPAASSSTTSSSTTTTTRPKPPPVPPPAALVRPTTAIDVRRPITPTAPLRVWVGGDSIAAGPAWAVGEAATATGAAVADTEFQVGTGLARPDFFDWRRHLAAVADARDPEVMVLLFGGNDIQPLDLPGGGSVSYGQPGWLEEYRRRVASIMDDLAVRGRRVVWVGLPPMSDPDYSAKMASLNEIYATEAAAHAPWVTFVDTWNPFSAPGQPGVFTRELPGADGVPQRVRFDDIHYDVHGSELLAAALLDHLRTFAPLP